MRISQLVTIGNEKLIVLGCLSGLVLLAAGCASSKKEVGLLGARPLTVPPAFSEPVPAAPATQVIPPEPVLPETAVSAATPTKETVEPAPKAIVLPPKVESKLLTHKVVPNDSLWKIAWMYNVSPEELAAANKLKKTETVKIGQTLTIPPGGHYIPLSKRPMPKPKVVAKKHTVEKAATTKEGGETAATEAAPADGKYKVQKNDNLWIIAKKFNVHSADIRKANDLKSDALHVGQELVIPQGGNTTATATATVTTPTEAAATTEPSTPAVAAVPEATATAPVTPVTTEVAQPPPAGTAVATTAAGTAAAAFPNSLEHTVLEGETLESIAEMYETKVDDILKANPAIKGNRDLKPNMSIMVPYK